MCGDNPNPPDWESIPLPPKHILAHLTDAHCHPTDNSPTEADLDDVFLGGLAAMATADDQDAVAALGASRPWSVDQPEGTAMRVVASFGYHPWFVHRFSMAEQLPSKEEHYRAVFLPRESQEESFQATLPHLPEPELFADRLVQLRKHVEEAKDAGRVVLVGEIGLDAAARVRLRPAPGNGSTDSNGSNGSGNRLTAFKTSMAHQVAIARAQLDVAVQLGVSVSFHCVAAPGATLDLLQAARKEHGAALFGRINICIHSCGGMSPPFLKQAAKVLPNTYFSPSIAVTSRSPSAAASVRQIPRERILVESDAADVGEMTKLVWAATTWIAECRGWRVENEDTPEWVLEEEDEEYDEKGRVCVTPDERVWVVKTLERNWARFLGLML